MEQFITSNHSHGCLQQLECRNLSDGSSILNVELFGKLLSVCCLRKKQLIFTLYVVLAPAERNTHEANESQS